MKRYLAGLLLLVAISCNNNTAEEPLTTVDSNVAGMPDSIPPTLHLDSHRTDTSFPVAMDSMGATINPQDTNYKKHD